MAFVEKRKKKHGDRNDGHRIKKIPVINQILVNLYPHRCDNEVSARYEIDVTDLLAYIKERKTNDPNCQIKFFHCFIAAAARVINEKPLLLRFVKRGKVYEKDEISISFVMKRAFKDNAGEAVITYVANKDDNVDSVTSFVLKEVNEGRDMQKVEEKIKASGSTESIERMPGFILRLVFAYMRFCDRFGCVPKSIRDQDPGFSTILLSNLGSIHCPSVYHHLNNYGTCSMMITIGTIFKKTVKDSNGVEQTRDFFDITAIFDERIADGFYFAGAIKLLEQYLAHPKLLEKKFGEPVTF